MLIVEEEWKKEDGGREGNKIELNSGARVGSQPGEGGSTL